MRPRRSFLPAAATALAFMAAALPARAQFAAVPASSFNAPPSASQAADARGYRRDAAHHVYAAFPMRVHKGKLPPLIYAVMITDTEIDDAGNVVNVRVARPPAAAAEVAPWVVALIRRASPFPAPHQVGERTRDGAVVYREIWLVDRSGSFQVDTLTEGQR